MKKMIISYIIAAITMVHMLFLSGCSKPTEPVPLQCNFTATVTATTGKVTESYTVVNTGQGITIVTYAEPANLKGLTYSYKGKQLTLKYGDLSYTPSDSVFPKSNLVLMLYDILNTISTNQPLPDIQQNGNTTIHSNNICKITSNSNNGNILQIKFKESDIIYNFTYKNN